MAESKEELKSLLMKVKEESEKAGLKITIQKTKIMTSSPITLWQIDRGKWEQWQILFSWAPKSLWIVIVATKLKDTSSLEEKLWSNLGSILKSRDITLLTKVRIVKAMVFSVVLYGCESWIMKKAKCQRIDAFELWWWRRLLRRQPTRLPRPWDSPGKNTGVCCHFLLLGIYYFLLYIICFYFWIY